MTKIEQLTQEAELLTETQIGDLIELARHMRQRAAYYGAPAEVHASIERGLAELKAGQGVPSSKVYADLDAHIRKPRR